MKCTLLKRTTLAGIPSASGIEKVGDTIYVMGDDSPWLFRLNERYEITEKIPVADVNAAVNGKIPKPVKPDLEAMVHFHDELLLFGSGSKSPQRDVLIRVNAMTKKTTSYSLLKFYDHLCSAAKITRNDLNLEAAVTVGHTLLLFNRGNNCIYAVKAEQLLAHAAEDAPLPSVEIFHATLPMLEGIQAGFSGACTTPDGKQIIFTASVENTSNWIDDGEIMGSFIGTFFLQDIKDSLIPDCVLITDSQNKPLKIKAEAIAVQPGSTLRKMYVLIATDNDESGSELLEGELEW